MRNMDRNATVMHRGIDIKMPDKLIIHFKVDTSELRTNTLKLRVGKLIIQAFVCLGLLEGRLIINLREE